MAAFLRVEPGLVAPDLAQFEQDGNVELMPPPSGNQYEPPRPSQELKEAIAGRTAQAVDLRLFNSVTDGAARLEARLCEQAKIQAPQRPPTPALNFWGSANQRLSTEALIGELQLALEGAATGQMDVPDHFAALMQEKLAYDRIAFNRSVGIPDDAVQYLVVTPDDFQSVQHQNALFEAHFAATATAIREFYEVNSLYLVERLMGEDVRPRIERRNRREATIALRWRQFRESLSSLIETFDTVGRRSFFVDTLTGQEPVEVAADWVAEGRYALESRFSDGLYGTQIPTPSVAHEAVTPQASRLGPGTTKPHHREFHGPVIGL